MRKFLLYIATIIVVLVANLVVNSLIAWYASSSSPYGRWSIPLALSNNINPIEGWSYAPIFWLTPLLISISAAWGLVHGSGAGRYLPVAGVLALFLLVAAIYEPTLYSRPGGINHLATLALRIIAVGVIGFIASGLIIQKVRGGTLDGQA